MNVTPVQPSASGSADHDPILMATTCTLNPGEPTRPVSRLDALRRELLKAKHTSQAPPNPQSRESHTTSSTVDRQREDAGGSDLLDSEGIESDDGEWEAGIDPQNISALASALWDLKRRVDIPESRFDGHISNSRDTCEAAGEISHRLATGPPTNVARRKRRRDNERA